MTKLEPDGQAEASPRLGARGGDSFAARRIDAHRLLAINVLSCGHCFLEVLGM
jgi:hypothetical protein